MAHVEAKKHLPVEADALWREIGFFQGVGEWHPMLVDVEGDGEHTGAHRVATSAEGQQQVERLVEVDQARRCYRYRMESSPLPVSGYVGEFGVQPADEASSIVVWSSDFDITSDDVEGTTAMIQGFLAAGLDALDERYR